MPVNLSYPKPRDLLTKVIRTARTDASTPKAVLPKGAFIVRVFSVTEVAADTGSPTYNLGWSGATTALTSGVAVASRGQGWPGSTAGSGVGTQLAQDTEVIGTFNAGTSTTGGTGYIVIEYIMAGPGESLDS